MTVKVEFSINTVELKVNYLYNHLNAEAICLPTSANQFGATTSISTLEPITGRKSETSIPRNIDGSHKQNYEKIAELMLIGDLKSLKDLLKLGWPCELCGWALPKL